MITVFETADSVWVAKCECGWQSLNEASERRAYKEAEAHRDRHKHPPIIQVVKPT